MYSIERPNYIHVGFGKPYTRSFHITLCTESTSTCIKRGYYYGYTIAASIASDVFDNIFMDIVKGKPINVYRYSNRIYYVYTYSDSLWRFLELLRELIYKTYRYCKTDECIYYIVNDIVNRCGVYPESCSNAVERWLGYIDRIIRRYSNAGRKALYTRFSQRTRLYRAKLYHYFPTIATIPIYRVNSIYYSSCIDESMNILRRFYSNNVAHRYSDRICSTTHAYIFATTDLFAITPSNVEASYGEDCIIKFGDQHVFIDDCDENEKHVVFKLINANAKNNMIYRVNWVSVLGLDKYSNQIFLHYIPPTLLLHSVKICREWLLGLVDDFGVKNDGYILIEV
ncbi:MAG: hypothetical protein QXV81_03350 [Ignisphaera sp.]